MAGTLTVTRAALTITADNQTRQYNQPNPVLTATCTGFVNGDTVAGLSTLPTLSTPATIMSATGFYAITAAGAVGANYSISYAPGTLTITKADQTITFNALQARLLGTRRSL